MSIPTINIGRVRFCIYVAAAFMLAGITSHGQGNNPTGSGLTPFQDSELRYADALFANGLASYSQEVIDKLNLPPEILDIRKVQAACALGDFAKAEAIVKTKGSSDSEGAWALRIALADGKYMWGKYDEAEKIYNGFFKKYPNGPKNPSLKGFYIASAYKYAQMMLLTGNKKAAIKSYESLLKAKPEQNVQRQVMGELVELLVQEAEATKGAERNEYIKQANKYIEDILWVQDLWFGRAIVAMAHIKKMQGDIDGAMGLIDEYTGQLKEIDKNLKASADATGEDLTRLSPMAECRYMVGVIMEDEAERILKSGGDKKKALELLQGKVVGRRRDGRPRRSAGAMAHFFNVFVRYPNTSWAPDAGKRFRDLKELLKKEWGIDTKAKISPAQLKAVEEAQFKEARVLFNQKNFKEAIDMYEQVLSLFPESETSVAAISELAVCYIEEKDYVLADVVVGYLAERFCRNKNYYIPAGEKVVGVALKYNELNQPERAREVYEVFFRYFKKHPRVAGELYRFANEAYNNKKYDEAIGYLNQIVEFHKADTIYPDALSRLAATYAQKGDTLNEIKTLKILIKYLTAKESPGYLLISAKFRFARALEQMGPKYVPVAIKKYTELEKLLSDEKARLAYQNSPDEAEANQKILQAAMLKHALADCRRTTVPPKVLAAYEKKYKRKIPPDLILKIYKKNAVKTLLKLADKFPKSQYAPIALSQAGTIYTVLNKPEEASKVLKRLQKEYPDSNEAKNVVFTIGKSLLELGKRKEAIAYFKSMFSAEGKYSSAEYLQAGKILFDAGEYKTAIEAFNKVISSEKTRAYLEPARVRKAQALCKLKEYDKASKLLQQLLKDYPKSGYTIDICRSAAVAFSAVASETGDKKQRAELFNEAVKALKRAAKFAKDAGTKAELEVSAARIYEYKAAAEKKFGSPEEAQQSINDAIAAYQAVIMFRDPNDKAVAPHLEDAYAACLPLMMEMKRWDDVASDADNYIRNFPRGKYIRQIRQYKNKARVSGGTAESTEGDTAAGGDAAAGSGAETEKSTEEK